MAGPVCGLMLADLGADVIKVEKLPGGDDRRMVPPDLDGEAAAFMMMNRNKRGIAIDLKQDAGQEMLRRLLARADVVIENYRKGTMEKLGLGYDELRRTIPGLIYCEISGFGRSGPYAERGGFDLIAQGMSGLMSITGEGHGRPPVKVGAPVTDITAGHPGDARHGWRPTPTACRPARGSGSTPRCSRPGSSTPTGSRPSPGHG